MKRFLILLIIPAFFLASCKNNPGEENSPTYAITVTYDNHGTASADKQTAKEGETVTLTASPNGGYSLEKWTVESGDVTIRELEDNRATFTMPAGDVSVRASFTENIFTAISDPVFKEFCKRFDTNGDGILSPDEAAAVTGIDLYSADIRSLISLDGIQYFTNLELLDCGSNDLRSLDMSGNKLLTTFRCDGNDLTSLDVSGNKLLTELNCSGNELMSLDVSDNTLLTTLNCDGNGLTSLDVSGNKLLTELNCSDNELMSLDVSGNTQLITLYCNGNLLAALDISNNKQLTKLVCFGNQLMEIYVWADFDLEKPTNSIKTIVKDDGAQFVKK